MDLTPFIGELPYGQRTDAFSTENASGGTSQAANILEALEAGSRLLLIDEDTSATNFMVRDARMQALVAKALEPITPFVDRVRELYERFGVSTILVMGGSGDYLDVADTVILMREYVPEDVTEQARRIARAFPTERRREVSQPLERLVERIPLAESLDPSRGRREVKIEAKAVEGWLRTGDLAMFDEEGDFYIVGRIKDVIISGGENIYPAEVESAMLGHPDVVEAALIGVPDPEWGEVGRAIVVRRPGSALTGEELLAYLRSRLASYKVPKSIVFVEDLPKTGAGKIDRALLRRRYGSQ